MVKIGQIRIFGKHIYIVKEIFNVTKSVEVVFICGREQSSVWSLDVVESDPIIDGESWELLYG